MGKPRKQPSKPKKPQRNANGTAGQKAQRAPASGKSFFDHPSWSRTAPRRAVRRLALGYKRLFLRLGWPLRIVLLAVTAVVGYFVAIVAIQLALTLFALLCVVAVFAMVFGGGKSGRRRESDWQRNEREFYQDLADAHQREQEDRGSV